MAEKRYMLKPPNFYVLRCFGHQQDSKSLFKGSIGHMTLVYLLCADEFVLYCYTNTAELKASLKANLSSDS